MDRLLSSPDSSHTLTLTYPSLLYPTLTHPILTYPTLLYRFT